MPYQTMPYQQRSLLEVRNTLLKGLSFEFLPLITVGLLKPVLEKLPEPVAPTLSLVTIILAIYGYLLCIKCACKYAEYKRYTTEFGLLGILNIFGLSILFFLPNKSTVESSEQEPLNNFSISAIFVSYVAVQVLITPVIILALIFIGNVEPKAIGDYFENEDFLNIIFIPMAAIIGWYFFHELNRSEVNLKQLLGSLTKIDLKLPIVLAIANYFFAIGTSSTILYCLSFVVPKYVENQINEVYATTPTGYLFFAIGGLIFAPIIEELFFRGIIFQKLAIEKGIDKALLISAIAFAIVHFRSDIISLFVGAVVLTVLYFKTKQIIVPIICHFLYNFIVVARSFYEQFYSSIDSSRLETIAQFQQGFIDHLELNILFVALSAPYLGYFIYKNFPRSSDIKKLPYFANR